MCVIKDKLLSKTNIAIYINVAICFLLTFSVSIAAENEIQKAIEAKEQGHYLKAIAKIQDPLKRMWSLELTTPKGENLTKQYDTIKGPLNSTLTRYPPTTI